MKKSVKLDELLESLKSHPNARAEVLAVTSDSRAVGPGTLFVAVKGGASDGHDFIEAARKSGAIAVVGERAPADSIVADSREELARLASAFHGHPSRSMLVVGVTGTSGKTTTTYLIESILKAAGHRVGVIGTVNFRFGEKVLLSTHTTPGAVELQQLLAEMKAMGATAVVMEVSSHALKQRRVAAVAFDGMVFTNLSPEHLDFHPDMADYFESKALLFTEYAEASARMGKNPTGAVNLDDTYGEKLLLRLRASGSPRTISFGLSPEADLSCAEIRINLSGINGKAGGIEIRSGLTGRFNAENILGAAAACKAVGIADEAVQHGIESLKSVPGRLERVENTQGMNVLVDYAHKPDALEKVLKTLVGVKGSDRLFTVFGCGGDRDRTKRPVMGKIAVTHSNHVIVTSDNPRTENPEAIIREILVGTQGAANFSVEPDRKKAIRAAIGMARPGDIVLIAGKGHEDYQIIADPAAPGGTRKIHFDDREVAAEAIAGAAQGSRT